MPQFRKSKAPRKAALQRRPGRPRADSTDQRERLLDAAIEHYTTHGIANANLRAIATSAAVTPALIGYYFGGKDALLSAVIEARLLPVVAELKDSLAWAGEDAGSLAAAFVRTVHALVRRHPWLPSLWIREIVTESGALRGLLLSSIAPQIPRTVAVRLAHMQANGKLHPDLDPRLLVVSLIGLTLFPLAAQSIWRQVFDATDVDDAALQAHTVSLLHRALENPHAQ